VIYSRRSGLSSHGELSQKKTHTWDCRLDKLVRVTIKVRVRVIYILKFYSNPNPKPKPNPNPNL
jgi:hypothetical protein